jgi:hypothetical protein
MTMTRLNGDCFVDRRSVALDESAVKSVRLSTNAETISLVQFSMGWHHLFPFTRLYAIACIDDCLIIPVMDKDRITEHVNGQIVRYRSRNEHERRTCDICAEDKCVLTVQCFNPLCKALICTGCCLQSSQNDALCSFCRTPFVGAAPRNMCSQVTCEMFQRTFALIQLVCDSLVGPGSPAIMYCTFSTLEISSTLKKLVRYADGTWSSNLSEVVMDLVYFPSVIGFCMSNGEYITFMQHFPHSHMEVLPEFENMRLMFEGAVRD